jgi:hypothetical protein
MDSCCALNRGCTWKNTDFRIHVTNSSSVVIDNQLYDEILMAICYKKVFKTFPPSTGHMHLSHSFADSVYCGTTIHIPLAILGFLLGLKLVMSSGY